MCFFNTCAVHRAVSCNWMHAGQPARAARSTESRAIPARCEGAFEHTTVARALPRSASDADHVQFLDDGWVNDH